MAYSYDRTAKAPANQIDRALRAKINTELDHAGFGGQRKFRRPGEALTVASEVLSKNGIEEGEVISSFTLNRPKGAKLIELAFSNSADPFSPTAIANAGLQFSWEELAPERYEVIAYIS